MTETTLNRIDEQLLGIRPIGLEELDETASLQTRVDRKYVLNLDELSALIDAIAHRVAVLEIDGSRESNYESVYFDTPEMDFYLGAARGRRRRYKVRTRGYLDSDFATLEVKSKGLRGQTVKVRKPHEMDNRRVLDASSVNFIDQATGIPGVAETLVPALTSSYKRVSFVDLDDVARLTIDRGLVCVDESNRTVTLDGGVIVETKSSGLPSFPDRWLWEHGRRPEKLSKYATSLAALDPTLPSNKWHRTLGRHFGAD